MKKNELKQARLKSFEELKKLVDQNKLELASFYAKVSVGGGKNLKKTKNLKVDIAQLLTLMREKEIIEAEESRKKGKK
jgi:ribosomal protein L29